MYINARRKIKRYILPVINYPQWSIFNLANTYYGFESFHDVIVEGVIHKTHLCNSVNNK